MIRDSRTLHGAAVETADDVRGLWHDWAHPVDHRTDQRTDRSFVNREGETGLLETGETTKAYISDGRWVADCPACRGGIAVWVGMPDGCCYDCGRIWQIEFPAPRDVARAEAILEKRPAGNRHWRPDDETIDDLKAANAVHGFDFTEEVR